MSGAVDAVSSKVLENRSLSNAGLGLQGAVPNLNITVTDGNANSSPKYNIRGIGSINSDSAEPLILVDNIPVTADEFSRMNANDIENVSVLKDASSAAIYGARAAFGVILVTTKSAKSEKISVAVNAYYSTRKITRLPEHVTDPYQVMTIQNQARTYSFYTEEQMAEAQKRVNDPSLPAVIVDPSDPKPTKMQHLPTLSISTLPSVPKKLAITFLANTTDKMVCSRKVTTSTTVTICVLK